MQIPKVFIIFIWVNPLFLTTTLEDVPLPDELPPGTELVTSDDDIPMPDGPPPGKEWALPDPPQPIILPVPPPPPGITLPPAGFPPWGMTLPTPPGFQPYNFPVAPPLPPPPPNFMARQQNLSSIQDPLSSVPHQTFQAHRASQIFPPPPPPPPPSQPTPAKIATIPNHPSLPPKPTSAAQMAAATIEGAPELRDLKKEATAFVPTAVKRKRAQQTTSNVLPDTPLPENE